ncbi:MULTISPECIES: hypothetical protein [Streptomyces]|uniref:hypothetical protein n=1 Tax=Streptomyces TaxID=1883 RepID=UPI0002E35B64|nr:MULTISPECIES: hypothetical protein [Streptomyces]MYS66015.1 hypothetical protein [Streptomyces sp. SID5473]
MTSKVRRCGCCRAVLPKDAGPNRRYCDATCRSRHWRRVQRRENIFQRAVQQGIEILAGGVDRYVEGRCPVCGWSVSLRKRRDSVYCSPRCRTRAWRLRAGLRDASERSLPETSPGDA